MLPYRIALTCVFLPLVAVHSTAAIGVIYGNLDTCIPYWSECFSISATGRRYPEFFVFKALLIPTAVFMAAYWYLVNNWLQQVGNGVTNPKWPTGLGVIACVALVVYTVTLGAVGEPYALARRIGVVFYFSFSAFAHLMLLKQLSKIDTSKLGIETEQVRMKFCCLVLVITAIASSLAGFFWDDWWQQWENAYEWWFSLFMISLFYQVGSMWRKTGFKVNFSVS